MYRYYENSILVSVFSKALTTENYRPENEQEYDIKSIVGHVVQRSKFVCNKKKMHFYSLLMKMCPFVHNNPNIASKMSVLSPTKPKMLHVSEVTFFERVSLVHVDVLTTCINYYMCNAQYFHTL